MDFQLEPGTSNSWVTGYAGTALALAAADRRLPAPIRRRAARAADRAADWLIGHVDADGAWGYRTQLRGDLDSTAWALRLSALRRRPIGESSWAFVDDHHSPIGYHTYRSAEQSGSWAAPSPDVAAAALLALHAAGRLTPARLAEFRDTLPDEPRTEGWSSQWWADRGYPTAIVAALFAATGGQRWIRDLQPDENPGTAWDLATTLWILAARRADPRELREARRRLIADQPVTGGWLGSARLVVPSARGSGTSESSTDARGVFTTATAIQALLAGQLSFAGPTSGRAVRGGAARRTHRDDWADGWVAAMAAAVPGLDAAAAARAFARLTRTSLRAPSPWPSSQLSSLAAGTPLEFSAGAAPALRLTTEVGDPLLPPRRRLTSGLADMASTARSLGLRSAWRQAAHPLMVLADPRLPVPAGNQFWLWAGLDLEPAGNPVLKAYVSLLAEDLDGWPARERQFLLAAGIPDRSPVFRTLEMLAENGWCHEAGVGVSRRGWGLKIYYELPGYRPDLVSRVLESAGLDPDPAALAPEVPGVVRASLAAKSRAGIALRVQPLTGLVTEVTVAAAFGPPLVGREVIARRVQTWLDSLPAPGAGDTHRTAVDMLLPGWATASPQARMHSLLTRSRSPGGDETKVYLRPAAG